MYQGVMTDRDGVQAHPASRSRLLGSAPDPRRFVVNRIAVALLVGGAVATVVSRPLVAYGGLPAHANYLHFVGVALAVMLLLSPRNAAVALGVRRWLGLMLFATIASWMWNGGQSLFAAALSWMVLAEPLMIVAATAELVRRGVDPRYFQITAISIVLVQLPFALLQLARYGIGDPVQGLLVQQGAGHHVFGFMAVVLALWALGRVISGDAVRPWREFALLSVGFIVGVITDTKQGVAAFVVVSALLVIAPDRRKQLRRSGVGRRAVAVVALGCLLFVGMQLNASSDEIGNVSRRDNFVDVKAEATREYVSAMAAEPGGLLLGLGPGRTATRLAWLSINDGTLRSLGITPSDITMRLAAVWNDPRNDSSSAASPFFTWLGLFGDGGLLGLGAYCAAWSVVWRMSRGTPSEMTVKGIIVLVFGLGVLFNWMEEPALMATAGLLIGASISARFGVGERHAVVW